MIGTVESIKLDRGYGFIKRDGNGPDVFFHCSALQRGLMFDDALFQRRVEFEVQERDGRAMAVNVRAADQ